MSLGEDRVRTKFNPSADSAVDQIKQKSAELIDLCEGLRADAVPVSQSGVGRENADKQRLISLAQTGYEEAAMWAVKAATAGK